MPRRRVSFSQSDEVQTIPAKPNPDKATTPSAASSEPAVRKPLRSAEPQPAVVPLRSALKSRPSASGLDNEEEIRRMEQQETERRKLFDSDMAV
jgi:hypothetical protein